MRRVIITIALACGLSGCARDEPQPEPDEALPELTAERAREALIDLIRSPEPGELQDFPLAQFEGEGVVTDDDHTPSWGPFSLRLAEREYTYIRVFGEPPRVCRWHFRGSFEFKNGQWVALPPRVESQALGPQ